MTQYQEQKKMMKVKKGSLTVLVGPDFEGSQENQRFVIPIMYLHHPLFQNLLDKAREVYGYHTSGPLRLPCSLDEFHHLRWRIEKETTPHHGRNQTHHYLSTSLSFHSC